MNAKEDSFKDQVVWITGASSGIGEALAKAFSHSGASVVLSVQSQLVSVWRNCPLPSVRSDHKALPLGQCGRAAGLVSLSVDQVAFEVEVVVDVGVD